MIVDIDAKMTEIQMVDKKLDVATQAILVHHLLKKIKMIGGGEREEKKGNKPKLTQILIS